MNTKDHWENVYKNISPSEASWYQEEPTVSLELIRRLPLKDSDFIIDVGGGASPLAGCLLTEGFKNITVLDLSSNALAHAQQQLGEASSQIEWLTEDIKNFTPAHKYNLWHDHAVFHFLTDKEDREKYKQALETSIKAGGYVIIAAFMIGGPTTCSNLDIVQYDAAKLRNELGMNFSLIEERSEKHITPTGKEQAFGYYVFMRNT